MREIRMSVRASENEAFVLQEICMEQKINMSALFRECSLTDFFSQQVSVRIDDIFEYSQQMYKISSSIEAIIKSNIVGNSSEISKIKVLLSDINSLYISNYKKIEKTRNKISKAIISEIKKKDNSQRYIEPSEDKMNVQYTICFTKEEHKKIIELAKDEGISISKLLKQNVFKKCGNGKIIINSYPLDDFNKEIIKKSKILKAIASKGKTGILNDMDINNTISLLEKVKEINIELEKIILTEQKDIRKEARRILKERSD